MRLEGVVYSLCEHELESFRNTLRIGAHALNREVHLIFEGGVTNYISTGQHEYGGTYNDPDFHLEMSDKSFCSDEQILVDMSGDPIWSPLIGKEVSITWRGPAADVLFLDAADDYVILFANGGCIDVSWAEPKWLKA
ncbi:MAG: hypothetical protein R3C60_05215 [Parvularculaceae bacterium]